MVLGKSQGVRASSFAIRRVLEVPNLSWEMEGYQGIKICSSHHFSQITLLHHHTTGYHPHPGILQGGQQHPRAGPGGLPKQADVFVHSQGDSLPCHPNQNTALKYGHWKASTVLGRGDYGSQHSTNCFCWLPAFQAKSNNNKKSKTTNI